MKAILTLLLSITIQIPTYGQYVNGSVIDKKTNSRIGYATVYFNGTFVGISADGDGSFKLDVSKNSSMPITVSAIGYFSTTVEEYSTDKFLIVALEPKSYEIEEVSVKAKSLERKRRHNLALFKEEFIGTTENAQSCRILNETDITFNYNSDDDTVKAYALKPIVVENMALGYKITCYLDKFEHYKKSEATFFSGNIIFEEIYSNREAQAKFREKRSTAYQGSRTHFFKSLYADALQENGYSVTNSTYKKLSKGEIVFVNEANNNFLKYTENLYIDFGRGLSYIQFRKEYAYFDSSGYFDPSGINWRGAMANQRIADWLPYEYTPE